MIQELQELEMTDGFGNTIGMPLTPRQLMNKINEIIRYLNEKEGQGDNRITE